MTNIQFNGHCNGGCKPNKQASLVGWTYYCGDCKTLAIENFEARERGEYFYAFDVEPHQITQKILEKKA